MHPAHRDTLLLEQARVMEQTAWPGEQYIMRMHSPAIAGRATAGSFVHMQCGPGLPMRRPLSIMQADADSGHIELLYKVVGEGTRLLSERVAGDELSLLGPIGKGFMPQPGRNRCLLIGGGVGMPPMIFLADALRRQDADIEQFVILGSEIPFPFEAMPSTLPVAGLAGKLNATMPLLEQWGIACRLASLQGFDGAHRGYVTDVARRWLDAMDAPQLEDTQVFACGPHAMLEAVAALAREYGLPCQVSLEEYMACGVGGCAGCTVKTATPDGMAMKRVCVDGPVFDADSVFF